ncbi:MAG: hypothetical protein KJ060_07805 [Candidatus Hydrogenedentes bacterium]|nr:hypothetical protein [Candidatus Hydrogenedentota bacterium]
MPGTIEKTAEEITATEMMKRDGETYMAVGLFIVALAIPVLIGTLWAWEDRRNAAIVNLGCGTVLGLIGFFGTYYGWKLFKRAKSQAS